MKRKKFTKAQMKKIHALQKKHGLTLHEAARFFVSMGI
jgi:hypothetical protein